MPGDGAVSELHRQQRGRHREADARRGAALVSGMEDGSRPRLCENSIDRAPVYKFQSIFGPFPPLQARRNEKVRS
jgi:hypothetical protein